MGKDNFRTESFQMGHEELLKHVNRLKNESADIQAALGSKALRSKMSKLEYEQWRESAKIRLETTNAAMRNAKQRLRELAAIRDLAISELSVEQANSETELLRVAYSLLKSLHKRCEFTPKEDAIMDIISTALYKNPYAVIDL